MMEDGIKDGRKFGDGIEDFYDGMEMEWKKFSRWKLEKTSSILSHALVSNSLSEIQTQMLYMLFLFVCIL